MQSPSHSPETQQTIHTQPAKHCIYEFKIPLPDKREAGFFVGAADHGGKLYMTWPGKAWGTPKLK
ncbi:hypothetical protein KEJ39_03625 [Candidatus Bathyarchaeota archaeon]|nr:hypothetical protein [Candidatus Bathyarchaeota archaeon]